ncbi:MAG TPA: 50S ribosomal protein L1 [Gammaproteobacteria bacterium]|nr:50S ribosomal protein L1 [Gammaproteobacteria bacterium]
MAALSKRVKMIREKVDFEKEYPVDEALALLKEVAVAKFTESVDLAVNLGVDPRKSDQVVRGSAVLPSGSGKVVRVAVFTQGEQAEKAKAAGADSVGREDLAESIQKGDMNYDVVIASPDAMRVVGRLGTVLGPRGLMPNPKSGTVAADVETAVKNAKAGQVRYRTDKGGVIHCSVGTVAFDVPALRANFDAVIDGLKKAKPSSAKGVYFKKMTLSTTMGPGLVVDLTSF